MLRSPHARLYLMARSSSAAAEGPSSAISRSLVHEHGGNDDGPIDLEVERFRVRDDPSSLFHDAEIGPMLRQAWIDKVGALPQIACSRRWCFVDECPQESLDRQAVFASSNQLCSCSIVHADRFSRFPMRSVCGCGI